MSTTLRILGWKAEGLRCPDHEVDCRDNQGQPFGVSLIQMPNGTGKTTTLSLLRAALSGVAEDGGWTQKQVRDLRKRDDTETGCLFELRLAVNEKPLTIIMEFDFHSGRINYKTTWGTGQTDGFKPPLELRRFMKDDFVNFYVFDGELAGNLLDDKHTDAGQAVETLFQVHLLSRMKEEVSQYWDRKTRSTTAKDKTGLTRRSNLLQQWTFRLDTLKKTKRKLERKLADIDRGLAAQRDQYERQISKEKNREEQLKEAEETVKNLKREIGESALSVLEDMRNPHALSPEFATAITGLKSGLDRVKLPESAAREFFEELSMESECVCGRPVDEAIRTVIRERARQYLGSDDVSLLNAMKLDVSTAVGEAPEQAEQELSGKMAALSDLAKTRQNARNELDALKHEAEQSNPEAKKAGEEIRRLEKEQETVRDALEKFDGKDRNIDLSRIGTVSCENVHSITTAEEVIALLEQQLEEVTGTLMLREKRNILTEIVGNAYEKARRDIASEVRDQANARIAEMMPHNNIRIDAIDHCLVLRDQSGGSVGETLSVGYAFLSTLFNRAGQHQLPFIVDSPANPIDYDIRPRIAEIMPKLTGQFIAFMISSEREKFLPGLKRAAGTEIQYITLFRKGARHLEEKALASPARVETRDGFHVTDETFFEDFQLDDEDG